MSSAKDERDTDGTWVIIGIAIVLLFAIYFTIEVMTARERARAPVPEIEDARHWLDDVTCVDWYPFNLCVCMGTSYNGHGAFAFSAPPDVCEDFEDYRSGT